MLAQPGVLTATLGYYHAMLDATKGDPSLAHLGLLMERPIAVSTPGLCGADDLRAELMTDQGRYFTGEYRDEELAGTRHFFTAREARKGNLAGAGVAGEVTRNITASHRTYRTLGLA